MLEVGDTFFSVRCLSHNLNILTVRLFGRILVLFCGKDNLRSLFNLALCAFSKGLNLFTPDDLDNRRPGVFKSQFLVFALIDQLNDPESLVWAGNYTTRSTRRKIVDYFPPRFGNLLPPQITHIPGAPTGRWQIRKSFPGNFLK